MVVPMHFTELILDKQTSVDDNYVDGASITYDAHPRKHIWTYAARTRSYNTLIIISLSL